MHKLLTVGFVCVMCLSVMADILALREALSNVVAAACKSKRGFEKVNLSVAVEAA